jgi:LysM repeat protein
MSPDNTTISTTTKLCPTCGTRLSEDATRCLVCGAELGSAEKPARPAKAVQGSRMPEITLSLPAALGLLAIFLTIGAVMVYFAVKTKPSVVIPMTPSATASQTVTPTNTPTELPPTETPTPLPSPTPLSYTVAQNDSCIAIAAHFGVSVNSIILLNNLSVDCLLSVGKVLLIPQPTPTITPLPTGTFSPAQLTEEACNKTTHTVAADETLSIISAAYGVPMQAIKDENGLTSDTVYLGQNLVIPLCKKFAPAGPTATPTSPPPYAAPNLLLPPDGAAFTLADETVTLQWSSVGTLRENESYQVTVEDITEGQARKQVDYVTDTKYIVPSTFRPTDTSPHIIRWWVVTVRQTGTSEDGKPIWDPAGSASQPRDFTWSGSGQASTPTP